MLQRQFLHLSFPPGYEGNVKGSKGSFRASFAFHALILSPAAASQLPDLVELVVPDGADRHILEIS